MTPVEFRRAVRVRGTLQRGFGGLSRPGIVMCPCKITLVSGMLCVGVLLAVPARVGVSVWVGVPVRSTVLVGVLVGVSVRLGSSVGVGVSASIGAV